MPRERINSLAELATNSPNWDKKDPPELQLRHDMMRAKLRGFLDRPDALQRAYPITNTSLPARYARAIATYRHGEVSSAIAQVDALIQSQSRQPVFLRAQGPGAAGSRTAGGGHCAVARSDRTRAGPDADPRHAGAGPDRNRTIRAWRTRR